LKKIERPEFEVKDGVVHVEQYKWVKHIASINQHNKMLEGAVEVTGYIDKEYPEGSNMLFDNLPPPNNKNTHKAYLIDVKLIEKETAEDVLRDLVKHNTTLPNLPEDQFTLDITSRAKAVLDE